MNIYLQEKDSGRWLKAPGTWVQTKEEARRFKSSLQAVDYCVRHDLRGVEMRLCFSDPRFDIVLEIPANDAP